MTTMTTLKSFATICLLIMPTAALAETCEDRFRALLIDGNGEESVKIRATQEIVGGMVSENYFYLREPGHWMTEMITPQTMQWTLTYNNMMFSSADKGRSWKKIRPVNSTQNRENAKAAMKENAKVVRNAKCGTEELDGVAHDVIEGDFSVTKGFKAESHYKFWVDMEAEFIVKAYYHIKADNFESKTTQVIEKAPGLTLPTPR